MTTTTPKQVLVWLPNPLFGATEGRVATVEREYWRNGEGWLRLRDGDEVFDSPDIFWDEVVSAEVVEDLRLIAAGNALRAEIEYDLEERGLIVQTERPYATLTEKGKRLLIGWES